MKKREEILQILSQHKSDWQERYKLRRISLFGSYARGDQQEDSDVDLLVEVDPSIGLDFVLLAETIEESLGLHVDLISTRAVKPRHWKYIQEELIDV